MSVCVSFLWFVIPPSVFEGSVFTLMAGSVGEQTRWLNGADLVAGASLFTQPLPYQDLKDLSNELRTKGLIEDFACE